MSTSRARAPHRLGDQKTRIVLIEECRRVELHELGVDDARAGAIGHGEAVTARAGRVGGAQKMRPRPPEANTVFLATMRFTTWSLASARRPQHSGW